MDGCLHILAVTCRYPEVILEYRKNPKNLDTPKNCCNYPKTGTVKFNYQVMGPKDVDRMANSVDLDQEQSDQGSHCLPRPICPKT